MGIAVGRCDAGYDDVSYGYLVGAVKIAEMLRWCQEAGIEMATVYLLSTENLQRDADELSALIDIIAGVVEEICAPANHWSVRTVGDLELLGEEPARRLREAVESTVPRPRRLPRERGRRLRRAAGDRRCRAGAAVQGDGQRRDRQTSSSRPSPSTPSPRTCTPRASPIPIWSSAPRASNGCPASCLAERLLGDVVHRGALARVPARRLPAGAARLHTSASSLSAPRCTRSSGW